MSVSDCTLLNLPRFDDTRGHLVAVEGGQDVPFEIARIYYLYGLPGESLRGCHAHIQLEQVIIPISGSFSLVIDDGIDRQSVAMNDPSKGLYICPMIWREVQDPSVDAVCLVLASENYDPSDYIYEYESFIARARQCQ